MQQRKMRRQRETMYRSLLFVFLVLVSVFIFRKIAWNSPLSSTRNEEASSAENKDCCYKLKSTVSALQFSIYVKVYKNQDACSCMQLSKLLTKEEKIQGLELFIREKLYLFENDIDFSQSKDTVKHASKAEEKVYELQKQIFELRREVQMQNKRRLEAETRAENADKKLAELSAKLENFDGKWFLSKLGLIQNKTQEYLMTLWHQHISPNLQKKWIPSIKDASVTLTTFLAPKLQYLTDKSVEVLYTAKQALTPYLTQGFNVSYNLDEVNRIMTTGRLHLEKVQVSLRVMYRKLKTWLQKVG